MSSALASSLAEALIALDARCAPIAQDVCETLIQAADAGHTCQPLSALPDISKLFDGPVLRQPDEQRLTPLVSDGKLCWLHQYFVAEQQVLRVLDALVQRKQSFPDPQLVQGVLAQLFPGAAEDDAQRRACAVALVQALLILTGGPGTGKTTTVARLLAARRRIWGPEQVLACAPTGKAAARLRDSLQQARPALGADGDALPREVHTVHRLLASRVSADAPLAGDVVLVDESSMLDVTVLAALCSALPSHATLILLGDPDQLASVEAGLVLRDLLARCQGGPSPALQAWLKACQVQGPQAGSGGWANAWVQLSHSWRFGRCPGIGAAAQAVQAGNSEQLLQACAREYPDLGRLDIAAVRRMLTHQAQAIARALCAADAHQEWSQVLVLCALKQGPRGVEGLNRHALQAIGGLDPSRPLHGMPLVIRRNCPELGLANGDIGIFWADAHEVLAYFPGNKRYLPPARLPAWEAAWALSIHRAQGSEAPTCLTILPREPEHPLLTRELLYTALTRAQEQALLCADDAVLRAACQQRASRCTGL